MSVDRIRQREASKESSAPQRAPSSALTRTARMPETGTRPPASACPCAGGCPRCLAPEGGQPLAQDVRERMEATLEHDFSRVRVHAGAAARDVAKSFDTQAVSRSTHSWLGTTQYTPGTPDGEPLPEPVRRRFETVLEHDLSHVRIHRDTQAHAAAAKLDAQAFTRGADIWFGAGQFTPGTAAADRRLKGPGSNGTKLVRKCMIIFGKGWCGW